MFYASEQIFVDILKGKLSLAKAIFLGRFKVSGNTKQLEKLMKTLDTIKKREKQAEARAKHAQQRKEAAKFAAASQPRYGVAEKSLTGDSSFAPESGSTSSRGPQTPPLEPHMPTWVPDRDTSHCLQCNSLFTFLRRKHHCRACGRIFCDACSSRKIKGKRTCDSCVEKILRPLRMSRLEGGSNFDRDANPTAVFGGPSGGPVGIPINRGAQLHKQQQQQQQHHAHPHTLEPRRDISAASASTSRESPQLPGRSLNASHPATPERLSPLELQAGKPVLAAVPTSIGSPGLVTGSAEESELLSSEADLTAAQSAEASPVRDIDSEGEEEGVDEEDVEAGKHGAGPVAARIRAVEGTIEELEKKMLLTNLPHTAPLHPYTVMMESELLSSILNPVRVVSSRVYMYIRTYCSGCIACCRTKQA